MEPSHLISECICGNKHWIYPVGFDRSEVDKECSDGFLHNWLDKSINELVDTTPAYAAINRTYQFLPPNQGFKYFNVAYYFITPPQIWRWYLKIARNRV